MPRYESKFDLLEFHRRSAHLPAQRLRRTPPHGNGFLTGQMEGDAIDPRTVEQGAEADPAPRRLSTIMAAMAAQATGPVSIGEIRDALADRSFAALLVLFAIFNLLPLPPGTTLVLGPPLVLVSAQMVLGYRNAWLPRFVLDKKIAPDRFRRSTDRVLPWLRRLEQLVRPRSWPFTGDRLIGAITLVLSIAITLPIPLGNWLPALSTAIIGLALSERDGIFFAIGLATAVLAFAVIGMVVGAAGMLAGAAFGVHF